MENNDVKKISIESTALHFRKYYAILEVIEDKEQRNELADIYEKNFKIFYSIALKLLKLVLRFE